MFSISYEHRIEKDIESLPKNIIKQALDAIETTLKYNPFIGKKLEHKGKYFYRYRIRDYRIVYAIDIKNKEIIIFRIRHRKEVYRGL